MKRADQPPKPKTPGQMDIARFEVRADAPPLKLLPGVKEYRKTATVHAIQMDRAFVVETEEGVMNGEASDYLCEGPAGERWPIKREIFERTYVTVIRGPLTIAPPEGDIVANALWQTAIELDCPDHARPGNPCDVVNRTSVVCRQRIDWAKQAIARRP